MVSGVPGGVRDAEGAGDAEDAEASADAGAGVVRRARDLLNTWGPLSMPLRSARRSSSGN